MLEAPENTTQSSPGTPQLMFSEVEGRLRAEREHLAQSLDHVVEREIFSTDPQADEIAAEMPRRDVEYDHRTALFERIRAIDDAIARLAEGSYGVCSACGARIGARRLEADPVAALCIVCQETAERGQRIFSI